MRLVEFAHSKIRKILKSGDLAIDATAGNGHDTLFLAKQVGKSGQIYTFDIQPTAIHSTVQRLKKAGLDPIVKTFLDSHTQIQKYIDQEATGNVSVAMFNLGYLPGGDHQVTTALTSTVAAILQCYEMIRPGGLISVIGYRGHCGGKEETNAVLDLCLQNNWSVEKYPGNDRENSPILLVIKKDQNGETGSIS